MLRRFLIIVGMTVSCGYSRSGLFLEAGPQFSSLGYGKGVAGAEPEAKLDPNFGIGFEESLTEGLGLIAGINHEYLGDRIHWDGYTRTNKFRYYRVSVLANHDFAVGSRSSRYLIGLAAGPSLGILSEYFFEYAGGSTLLSDRYRQTFGFDSIHDFDYGLKGGVRLESGGFSRFGILFKMDYYHGLANIADGTDYKGTHHQSFSVSAGFKYYVEEP